MKKYNVKAKWLVSGRLYYVHCVVDAVDAHDAVKKALRTSVPGLMQVTHAQYCGGEVEQA